jgi:hypothetical protein
VPGALVRAPGSRGRARRPYRADAPRSAPRIATRNAAPPASRRATRRPPHRDAQRGAPRIATRNAATRRHGDTKAVRMGGIETRMTRTSNARGWRRRTSRGTARGRRDTSLCYATTYPVLSGSPLLVLLRTRLTGVARRESYVQQRASDTHRSLRTRHNSSGVSCRSVDRGVSTSRQSCRSESAAGRERSQERVVPFPKARRHRVV